MIELKLRWLLVITMLIEFGFVNMQLPMQMAIPRVGGMIPMPPSGGMMQMPPSGGIMPMPPIGSNMPMPPIGGMMPPPPYGGMIPMPPYGGMMSMLLPSPTPESSTTTKITKPKPTPAKTTRYTRAYPFFFPFMKLGIFCNASSTDPRCPPCPRCIGPPSCTPSIFAFCSDCHNTFMCTREGQWPFHLHLEVKGVTIH